MTYLIINLFLSLSSNGQWTTIGQDFIQPIERDHYVITQRFSRWHTAIDMAAKENTTVVSPTSGVVIFTGWYYGYGNFVKIQHVDGYITCYGHLNKIFVKENYGVNQGEPIGLVGSTGKSTGPHLHFEVKQYGGFINPERILYGSSRRLEMH